MRYKTVDAILNPDGSLSLPRKDLPERPVRVMIAILDAGPDGELSALGDYLEQLTDYEERLERGEIQWR